MTKILFICHGNICRSPMAEFVLKDMAEKMNIDDRLEIASCATSTEEIWNGRGNPVYPPARKKLAEHGISCEGKRAVLLKKSDYDEYDLLIGMDENNIRNIGRMTGRPGGEKIHKMMEFAGENRDVADPWYTGDFAQTYEDVYNGCLGLIEYLKDREMI